LHGILLDALLFFEHDFGGLDYRGNGVAHFQLHFNGAAFRDHAFDQILACADDNVGHHAAELEFYNFSREPVPR
jgi:hypothetical protein